MKSIKINNKSEIDLELLFSILLRSAEYIEGYQGIKVLELEFRSEKEGIFVVHPRRTKAGNLIIDVHKKEVR